MNGWIIEIQGAHLLCHPGAFNMTTGPLHWELLQRARISLGVLLCLWVPPPYGSYLKEPTLPPVPNLDIYEESVVKAADEMRVWLNRALSIAHDIAIGGNLGLFIQDEKEKRAAPAVQLNVIYLLAEMNVAVNNPEVVDMILPLFIESLEKGDASTPGLLRLCLLDAVSCIASLGFEKSYREAIVLMIRSYLSKLSTVGSAESRTQTLPAGFLLVAKGIMSNQLCSDYRHRFLSLCSDVGLAAESKSGRSGADFLGPLLHAVAEMCSDFDPSVGKKQ
ncbi:Phosphatidylinositol 4-kinase alpha 1 [Forsythia ovata]|uniref:Phosphatidylinositol 4-kinase alpha 1 n=1 Tax=Forsythia ovata TaxID=205694 RepID=A0ABD1QSQ0_9LAMI